MSSRARPLPPRRVHVEGRQLAIAVGLLAATLAVYAPILYHMVRHWSEVPDYSHGFIVAPLAI